MTFSEATHGALKTGLARALEWLAPALIRMHLFSCCIRDLTSRRLLALTGASSSLGTGLLLTACKSIKAFVMCFTDKRNRNSFAN